MIISGVGASDLQPINDAEMLKMITGRFQKFASARLLCILVTCYSVPDKEFKLLLGQIKTQQETVEKIRQLAGNTSRSFKRIWPVMNDSQKAEFKRKLVSGFDQLRAPSSLIEIAKKALNNQLPQSDFSFIGGEPLSSNRKKNDKAALLRARDPNAGKLIIFVLGGLTRTEVYGLQNLEKELAHE